MALDLQVEEPPTDQTPDPLDAPVAETVRTRILLVEDDNEMRMLLAQALREENYDVIEAYDGEDASRALALEGSDFGPIRDIDLIVTDVRMPRSTGLDLLSHVRFFDWAVPVVLISAFADQEMRDTAQRLGAAAVLAKPFSLQSFLQTVRETAAPRSAVR
ncbi:MAG: response regulator [Deltaproteobacteria bacterium]|nr:response regulator [Deltaproteobacteria bacterium]